MELVSASEQPNRDETSTPKVSAYTAAANSAGTLPTQTKSPTNGTRQDEPSKVNHAPSKSLSLSIDTPASSSPFPSPSSSFVPPPSDHEFALSPVPRKQSEVLTTIVLPPPEAINEPSTFNNDVLKPSLFNAADETSTISTSPTSDNQAALLPTDLSKTPRLSSSPSLPPASPAPVFSLPASTRPAPPSPAASRRTSRAISTHSSSRSIRNSWAARPARLSTLSVSMLPLDQEVCIRVVDFGFQVGDDRRSGLGEYVPKTNRPVRMNRRLIAARNAAITGQPLDDSDDEEDNRELMGDGWGDFSWGQLSYSSFPSYDGGGPSQGELDANFGQDTEDDNEYHSADEGDGDLDTEGEEGPLYPGIYRALYAFEPEGNSEMKLVEDQLVRILGRGEGVGWAIAERGDGQHALVPEAYLEVVRLDGEDED